MGKAVAVVVGGIIGIPISITMVALVAILFPPVLWVSPLVIGAGWAMGFNVASGRQPEDFGA